MTPLVRALDDPTVAVVGGWGIVSADLRKFEDAPAGDVDAIEGYVQAFRRADAAARGPLDERFRFYRNLDIWWSLVLRDEGEGSAAPASGQPRRPARGPPRPSRLPSLPDDERDRQSKRNFYRIIDRFGWRTGPARQPLTAAGADLPLVLVLPDRVGAGRADRWRPRRSGRPGASGRRVLNMTVRTASVYAVRVGGCVGRARSRPTRTP